MIRSFGHALIVVGLTLLPQWGGLTWWFALLFRRRLEPRRTTALMRGLLHDPRTAKVFLEPALAAELGLSDPHLRFQGCRAARHDDHIHVQL